MRANHPAAERDRDEPGGEHAGHDHDHALGADPATKRRLLDRLRRIEGQVRGLQRMVEEDRYCPEILQQVAAVQASLGATAEALLHGHLRHCVTAAVRSGDAQEAERVYAELAELYRRSR